MILSVCASPCLDVTFELDAFNVGKTNVVKSKSVTYGGKGLNVAVGVKRLGGSPYLTGFMYNENGYAFENVLDHEGVPCGFVWERGRVRENYKFIDSRSMLTEVNDVGGAVGQDKREDLIKAVHTLSKKSAVTVLSGGLPQNLDDGYYGELAQAIAPNSLKIVDTHGARMFAALRTGVDLVKPNLDELENTLGRRFTDKEDLLEGCYELLDRGAKRVLVSLGKAGALVTDGSRNLYCKSMQVAVNSTVGAGDAMVAAAAIALGRGEDLEGILRSGVAAGTARVMSPSASSFTKTKYDEVTATLHVTEI